MIIKNSLMAINAENVLNRNTKSKEKNMRRLGSGEKITSAGDDASNYAISEKMRVQIKALDQNLQNVQNGSKLLRTAEGGIQNQIEIMKRLKEEVVKAANGIYTSDDLQIIQRNIDSMYEEIQDIAVKTNFNGITMLMGGTPDEVVVDWAKLPAAQEIKNSQLDLIPGGTEPFSKVKPYTLDFAGETAASLKGKVFTFKDSDGVKKTFMFADGDAGVPSGVTRIPVTNGSRDYTANEIASQFASALGGYNALCYNVDGTKAQVYCDSAGGRPTNKPFTVEGLEDTFKTCDLDGAPLAEKLTGGTAGTKASTELDFSSYNTSATIAALKGQGFRVYGRNENGNTSYRDYVFDDGTGNYPGYNKIDISGVSTAAALAAKVSAAVSVSYVDDAVSGGTKIKFTSQDTGSAMNQCYVEGITLSSSPGSPPTPIPGASNSGLGTGHLSGGVNPRPYVDADNPGDPGQKASMSLAYTKPPVDSGIQIRGHWSNTKVRFVSGSSGPTYDSTNGEYQIGVDKFKDGFTWSIDDMDIKISGGRVILTARQVGTTPNSSWGVTSDGFSASTNGGSAAHDEIKPLIPARKNFVGGADSGDKAKAEIDISSFADKDDMIDKLAGTGFYFKDTSNGATTYVEFINSAEVDPDKSAEKNGRYAGSIKIDLNNLPGVGSAQMELITLMKTADPAKFSGTVDNSKLIVTCANSGTKGNNSEVKTLGSLPDTSEGTSEYAKYPVDFEDWINTHAADIREGGGLVKYLTNKGFRTDCSTCPNQWFNFEFVSDDVVVRPNTSGDGTLNSDIHNYSINISAVTDAKSLVQAIYDQGIAPLKNTNHFMMMDIEKDVDGNPTGTLVMYDNRLSVDPDTRKPRADNAVIHDGIKSDWARADRALMVDTLYIQDMDRSSLYLHLKIPRTTLDNIFNYNEEYHGISEYNVLTKESRDKLLGAPPAFDGDIDKGINYLVSAVTLVGAQQMRLEHSEENIVTKHENISSAESTIRDANMAQEMANLVKNSVLEQSAQFMLSQANQKTQGVLSLLGQ